MLGPRLALLPLGIGFGLAVEWAFYDASLGPGLTAADLTTGCTLIACGVIAWDRRPESRVGALMVLAGFSWFLGNVVGLLLYLHRGPLVHLHLSYPSGRLRTRLARGVVAIAYLDAVARPLASNSTLTLVLSGLVALTALRAFLGASGSARKAAGPALAAALAFAAVLALGAMNRLNGWPSEHAVLWIYDLVIASVPVVLLVDLLRGRWAEAVVTGLVVDLGSPAQAATLRTKLARALGDPLLVVAYRLRETGDFVDDAGRPVQLPPYGSGRTVTPLVDRGEEVAVLVHDERLLADRELLESVAAAARIAVANASLQAEALAKAAELEASRRRIVEAADAQRRGIHQKLEVGPGQRLESVASLLASARTAVAADDAGAIAAVETELVEARRELEEFAHGVLPAALTEEGLMPAVTVLAHRSAVPVEVTGNVGRLPAPVEAALFYVCSEALANVIKHAAASHATIGVRTDGERVVIEVADDGVGGAGPNRGSGLLGLADRVEALGGTLRVASPLGAGTRIIAELPVRRY
jgi:signal transduction histidine kinase